MKNISKSFLFILIPNCLYFLSFFFSSLHRLIIKIAVNIFWRWDLPIYLNFLFVVYVLFLSASPHFTLLVGKCESYYGNREGDDFLLS